MGEQRSGFEALASRRPWLRPVAIVAVVLGAAALVLAAGVVSGNAWNAPAFLDAAPWTGMAGCLVGTASGIGTTLLSPTRDVAPRILSFVRRYGLASVVAMAAAGITHFVPGAGVVTPIALDAAIGLAAASVFSGVCWGSALAATS